MTLKNRLGQSSIEMLLIMGFMAVVIVPLVSSVFRGYMKSFGNSLITNMQSQIRYGVSDNAVSNKAELGNRDAEALEYSDAAATKHPFAAIDVGWAPR